MVLIFTLHFTFTGPNGRPVTITFSQRFVNRAGRGDARFPSAQ